MGKPNLDELKSDNAVLSRVIVGLIEENELLRAKIRVNDTDMAERIKTLETVNKRHQEEIKRLRKGIKEIAELIEEYDSLLELAITFIK